MIAKLRGIVQKLDPTELIVEAHGVGYRVTVPIDVWDTLKDAAPSELWVSTYIREDRMDLFGFLDRAGRTLFEALITLPGIGPKLALELCAVPRTLLTHAVAKQDPAVLTSVKGVGKKTAEKLLVELRALVERKPDLLGPAGLSRDRHEFDQDAVAALSSLGYDTPTVLESLRSLPQDLTTTEERVTAALRSL
jgi:Holliday junction DNA helicase RuvA